MSPRSTLDPTLARLAAELALVQSLVRGTLARRAGFRADTLRAQNTPVRASQEEADALLFDLSLSEQVEPQFEQRLRLVEAERDMAFKAGEPVSQLRKAFSLSRRELTVWMLCAAPQLDYRYGRLYGLVLDDLTRCHASDDLLQAVLSVGLSTHAQLRAQLEESAPLRALGLIEIVPGASAGSPLLRVPGWLIDFMLGTGSSPSSEPRASSIPPAPSATQDKALTGRFFAEDGSPRCELQALVGALGELLPRVLAVCVRARIKPVALDLRPLRAERMREELRRAAQLAALREQGLLVLVPPAAEHARSQDGFIREELAHDLAQLAKHLPLCATLEEGEPG